jgi:hypothetical protein
VLAAELHSVARFGAALATVTDGYAMADSVGIYAISGPDLIFDGGFEAAAPCN